MLLKTGSLDNKIREFSLAWPSWVMSHYTMFYKYDKCTCDFLGHFYVYFTIIIPLMLVGYEMIIAYSYLTRGLRIIV